MIHGGMQVVEIELTAGSNNLETVRRLLCLFQVISQKSAPDYIYSAGARLCGKYPSAVAKTHKLLIAAQQVIWISRRKIQARHHGVGLQLHGQV